MLGRNPKTAFSRARQQCCKECCNPTLGFCLLGSVVGWCLGKGREERNRGLLRESFRMVGGTSDGCVACCCIPCSVSQVARELKYRGYQGVSCCGLSKDDEQADEPENYKVEDHANSAQSQASTSDTSDAQYSSC